MCFISILRKVDLSIYGEKVKEGSSSHSRSHQITNYLNNKAVMYGDAADMTITSEFEIQ